MTKLKETFLKKYSIYEYILMLVGLAFLIKVVEYLYITSIKEMTWTEIGIITVLLCIGTLAVSRPLAVLDYARKKLGLETREEKFTK